MKHCNTCVHQQAGHKADFFGHTVPGKFCARFPPHPHYGPPKARGGWGCGEHVEKPYEPTDSDVFATSLDLIVKNAAKRLDAVNESYRHEIEQVKMCVYGEWLRG